MSEFVKLQANDGHELDVYISRPAGKPTAGLVLIQEIFGVNQHIRSVADGYAKDGFLVAAPAIFDRIERNVQLDYTPEDMKKAFEVYYPKLDPGKAVVDAAAAVEFLKKETGGKVGTIGYCFGGLVSWLCATRLPIDAAVGYYAGGIGNFAQETPKVPVMLHFGKLDTHIPAEQVEKVRTLHPEVEIFWYENAEHAFNRDVYSSYNTEAAKLARERSLAFLKRNLG